ncbi:MAG TPA: PHP domain-containing protein [Chitinophagaceae bacterium]
MDNYTIADNFSLLSKLMDINGENSFKTKTYSIAAYNIEKMPLQLKDTPREKLFGIKGIGDSIGKKVIEMLDTGKMEVLNEFITKTPPGVIEMLNIKGIGPKKIHTIWKEMELESIGELLYACNENRLTLYKGFGEKTQQNVIEAIEFYLQNQGHYLYAELEILFPQVDAYLKKIFSPDTVRVTGAYRRQELTIEELEFVILEDIASIKTKFQTAQPPELLEETDSSILYKLKNGLKLRLYHGKGNRAEKLFQTTGNAEFVDAFQKAFPKLQYKGDETENDEIIFTKAKITFVPPYIRESAAIIEKAKKNALPVVIQPADVRSVIHSHSNWSDGSNTIEEMANECIKRGFEYLIISDHSKAAAYANGLTEERIREQHRYVDELNKKLKPFKIFKSIECDILNDGSMDYDNKILATFDLIIASVHSNLKMNEEKAMMRLMKAIENPYTTILGHMTGRLLLSRNGYPIDHKKIIDACAANHVAIELNAHPRRLDIDWKWIKYALEKKVLLSIDPDAHALDGYDDIKYGVLAAQKGGLTKENNLSSFSLKEFENFLAKRRALKKI